MNERIVQEMTPVEFRRVTLNEGIKPELKERKIYAYAEIVILSPDTQLPSDPTTRPQPQQ